MFKKTGTDMCALQLAALEVMLSAKPRVGGDKGQG